MHGATFFFYLIDLWTYTAVLVSATFLYRGLDYNSPNEMCNNTEHDAPTSLNIVQSMIYTAEIITWIAHNNLHFCRM